MTIDQALRDALGAVASEVEVTDEDLTHADHRFIHRREQLARRRRWTHGLVAAGVAAGLVVAGTLGWRELADDAPTPQPARTELAPATEVLPLTVDTLSGIWLTHDSSGWMWSFHRNGTVSFVNPSYLDIEGSEPVAYTVTDTGIELPDDLCDWSLQVNSDGTMVGQVVRVPDPPDSPCAGAGQVSWIRLSPQSERGAGLVWTGSTGEDEEIQAARLREAPTPVESVDRISRTWLQQGTGRLLDITTPVGDGESAYVLDDEGELFTTPADVGQVKLSETGELRLTSTAASPGCPEGSTAVLGDLVLRGTSGSIPPMPAPSLEVTLRSSECSRHDDLGGIWVQVS